MLILLTYFALQIEKILPDSILYRLLNALGAVSILTSLYFKFNISAFLIEFFWLVISLYGIFKNLKREKNEKIRQADF